MFAHDSYVYNNGWPVCTSGVFSLENLTMKIIFLFNYLDYYN